MSNPTLSGSEFLVNTATAAISYQTTPSITGLEDGRFVVTWENLNAYGGSIRDVHAQVMNADGSKSGAEFQVNATAAPDQYQPSITALSDGGFVVAWDNRDIVTIGRQVDYRALVVRAQVFNADGSPRGAEIQVNTSTGNQPVAPTITALDDGRFVVAWTSNPLEFEISPGNIVRPGLYNFVRAQVFNADGTKSGAEFQLNADGPDLQAAPDITALTDGRLLATWDSINEYGGQIHDVHGQLFNADGSKMGADFVVNTTLAGRQTGSSTAAMPDGRFVVVWEDANGSSQAVYAQVFNADGSKRGAEFQVNTTTVAYGPRPDVTALADGRFVVTWGRDPFSTADIYAQVFNTDGSRSGTEFLVNTTTDGFQSDPAITALADGRFAVAWQGGNAADVSGQIFDPRMSGVSLTGTALADQWVGTGFDDVMQGGAGDDGFDGGAGSDTASYAERVANLLVVLDGAAPVAVVVGGVAEDTIRNIENLVGGSGSDFFFGDALANAFSGGAGIDVLLGQGGNDRILGGEGVDYLYGGDNDDQLEGENGGDALFGDAGNDVLLGGAGADYIDGGTGADYADGGDANDIFLMGADNDTVLGQAGNDYADLSGGDDYADGGAGEDILLGGLGNDVLLGGADADYIDAGDGFDYADGGEGNDIFLMGAGNDTAVSQGGIDFFDMGEGDDTATGGAGNDIFLGGAGNDFFDAGAGTDVALGASGNDSYLLRSTSGLLLIYDFAASGAGDVLRLTADTGIASFAQAQAKLSFNASVYASVLTVDADTSVWLVGVTNAQLTAADFAFG